MATKVIDGVYQLLVPIPNNPLGNTNVYLIQRDDGYLLLDTGWNNPEALRALETELGATGATFKDIRQIVVTHAHIDHYGLAGAVRERSGAKIYMHHRDQEIFRMRYKVTEDFMRQAEEWYRANGVPVHELPIRMNFGGLRHWDVPEPDVELQGGETIDIGRFKLEVIWTPGHSPGHICLYDRANRIFYAGDHILPVITPNIGLPPGSDGNPLGEFIASLKSLRELDVETVLPAHEAIFHNLPKRIDEIIHHHEVRKHEILAALGENGSLTAYELSNHITWMPELGGVQFRDLATGDKRAAVSETLAHLRAMTVDGAAVSATRQGIIYYERAE